GRHSIVEVSPGHFRRHGFDVRADTPTGRPRWGAFIDRVNEFDFETFALPLRDAVAAHPEERLLLEEAWHCFESAGYDPCGFLDGDPGNIGVYVGASFHDYPFVVADASGGGHRLPYSSQTFTYANRLSYFFNLSGPTATLDTASSSSLYAASQAYHALAAAARALSSRAPVLSRRVPSRCLRSRGGNSGARARGAAESGAGGGVRSRRLDQGGAPIPSGTHVRENAHAGPVRPCGNNQHAA